jgi:hypothetical protein
MQALLVKPNHTMKKHIVTLKQKRTVLYPQTISKYCKDCSGKMVEINYCRECRKPIELMCTACEKVVIDSLHEFCYCQLDIMSSIFRNSFTNQPIAVLS